MSEEKRRKIPGVNPEIRREQDEIRIHSDFLPKDNNDIAFDDTGDFPAVGSELDEEETHKHAIDRATSDTPHGLPIIGKKNE